MKTQVKKDLIVFFILLFLTVLLFFIINLFTIKNDHDGVSGNGNLGLIFIFPAIPLYVIKLAYVYRISQYYYRTRKNLIVFFWILLLLLCVCIYGEYQFAQSLLSELGGGPSAPHSIIYRWRWLNQYTNTLFFNFFTFTLGILLTLLISGFMSRRKIKKSQQV